MLSTLFLAFLLFLLFPGVGGAAQQFDVEDGQTITVIVSARELTRISVAGEERLENVWAPAGHLQIQPDLDQGDVFIKPTSGAPASMSFFVRDSGGGTYTIIAQQRDVPSETILLTPQQKPLLRVPTRAQQKTLTYVKQIKRLMRAMALGQDAKGFTQEAHETLVPLWKEARLVLKRSYTGFAFIGQVFEIQNISDKPMTFHEQEFIPFGSHVRAVALRRLTVPTGQSTELYIVREQKEAL